MIVTNSDYIYISNGEPLRYEINGKGLLMLTKLLTPFGKKAWKYFETAQAKNNISVLKDSGVEVTIIKGTNQKDGCLCSTELLEDVMLWLKRFIAPKIIPTTKQCSKCKEEKLFEEFPQNQKTKICTTCACQNRIDKINENQLSFFKNLRASMYQRTKVMSKAGRKEFVNCVITENDLIEIYTSQNGLCWYSKIPMILNINSNYKVSVERLDNSKGYTRENIVLCCHEMNGAFQWNEEKINKLFNLIDSPSPIISNSVFNKIQKKKTKCVDVDNNRRKCLECKEIKSIKCFPNFSTNCAQCRDKVPVRKLQKLLANAKHNSRARKYNGNFTLTMKQVQRIYFKQCGRCFYSDVLMSFDSDEDFTVSIERLDPKLNYTEDNVVLIAKEFNIGFNGCWTKEKFQYFRSCYETYHKKLSERVTSSVEKMLKVSLTRIPQPHIDTRV